MRFKILFSIAIICLFVLSFFFPVWTFNFKAPQYPMGLNIDIHLTGAKGDVFEIDIINHYIGMSKLETAAAHEKKLAPYGIALLCLLSLTLSLRLKKSIKFLLCSPIIFFPVAFVVIFYFWLYTFGHNLNPTAPVHLQPFTPVILGEGIIGQFRTYAYPMWSFYFFLLASMLCFVSILTDKETKNNSASGEKDRLTIDSQQKLT